MNKKTKGIIAVLVVLIIAIAIFLCYTYGFNSNEKESNSVRSTNNIIENKGNANKTEENKVEENVVQNSISNEVNEIAQPEETEPVKPEEEPVDEKSEIQTDNDEDRAISIVKNDWGDSSGVAFKIEHINNDGSYEIVVRNEDGNALAWYTVNPKTGTFSK